VRRALVCSDFGETVTIIKRELDDECLLEANHGQRDTSKTMALGINSTTNNTFGNNQEVLDCVVCGDRATGRHRSNIVSTFVNRCVIVSR
jgi:hypothetical protein